MKKRDYRKISANADGWCNWQSPIHGQGKHNYRLACCDCQLVHEMQFRVRKDRKGMMSVTFRVKRNNRATSALRRRKQKSPRRG
jgi:hypothetical protein